MFCPFCQTEDTKVIDSRLVADGSQIRRRRSCEVCHSRFTTFETADLALPRVIKTNGERQPFNGSKLKKGMLRALEKRPLSTEEIDTVFGKILKEIRTRGVREIKSIEITDAAKKESQEIINDLIIAAFNNAKENLKKKSAEELSKVTGGLNLPLDFKLPF